MAYKSVHRSLGVLKRPFIYIILYTSIRNKAFGTNAVYFPSDFGNVSIYMFNILVNS